MLLQLEIFDEHIEHIEKRILKRLPESERKARGLLKLCRVVDSHAGLRESFPSNLQKMLRVMEYGPDDAWRDSALARELMRGLAAGAALSAGEPASADAVVKCALERSMAWISRCYDVYRLVKAEALEDSLMPHGVLPNPTKVDGNAVGRGVALLRASPAPRRPDGVQEPLAAREAARTCARAQPQTKPADDGVV
ncbi:MAG: hypothetical protein EBR51_02910 [Gammaproteobacteria bacterium]|jgi:hypothetical protein|nr:hypothetical protein [Gammaproteobacteria bacterium]